VSVTSMPSGCRKGVVNLERTLTWRRGGLPEHGGKTRERPQIYDYVFDGTGFSPSFPLASARAHGYTRTALEPRNNALNVRIAVSVVFRTSMLPPSTFGRIQKPACSTLGPGLTFSSAGSEEGSTAISTGSAGLVGNSGVPVVVSAFFPVKSEILFASPLKA
jgi:hypothetical protein